MIRIHKYVITNVMREANKLKKKTKKYSNNPFERVFVFFLEENLFDNFEMEQRGSASK